MLTILSKSHIFLIGKPGVGKSYMLSKVCGVIREYVWFYKAFSDETKEKHIFGTEKEDEKGVPYFVTDGMMPEANFAFLDEVFKGTKEMLDALLNIANERIFKNGNKDVSVPIYTIFGASNEFAKQRESPFFDRLHFKYDVLDIKDPENFKKFMRKEFVDVEEILDEEKFELADIDKICEVALNNVSVSKTVEDFYTYKLRDGLINSNVAVSTRTWGVVGNIFKISAFLNNRDQVDFSDMFLVLHITWSSYRDKNKCRQVVFQNLFGYKEKIEADILKCTDNWFIVKGHIETFEQYLTHSAVIAGANAARTFNEARGSCLYVHGQLSAITKIILEVKGKHQICQLIEKQIENNIFLLDFKNDVFTEDMIARYTKLLDILRQNLEKVENWATNNKTLHEYQDRRFYKLETGE